MMKAEKIGRFVTTVVTCDGHSVTVANSMESIREHRDHLAAALKGIQDLIDTADRFTKTMESIKR